MVLERRRKRKTKKSQKKKCRSTDNVKKLPFLMLTIFKRRKEKRKTSHKTKNLTLKHLDAYRKYGYFLRAREREMPLHTNSSFFPLYFFF